MKRLMFVTVVCALVAVPALASLTPINPTPNGNNEPSLLVSTNGYDPILEHLYGAGNFVRIDDDFDQLWTSTGGNAHAEGKWAATAENFGYISGSSGGSQVTLFGIAFGTNGYLGGSPSGAIPSMPIFRLGINDGVNPTYGPWSSQQSDNTLREDHMVTWLIPSTGHYVVGWEIEEFHNGTCDFDYQDLVVEVCGVRPVPVPGAVLLGLLGLSAAGLKLRRFA